MPESVFVKVTSAVAIDGEIHAAGSIVQVGEDLAVNLLQRGKVEVATSEDAPAPEPAKPAKAAKPAKNEESAE